MFAMSIWHWLILVLAVLPAIPISHILRRVGLSPWFAVLAVIPPLGYVALFIFAYARWPVLDSERD